jgi:hypothetical protein
LERECSEDIKNSGGSEIARIVRIARIVSIVKKARIAETL